MRARLSSAKLFALLVVVAAAIGAFAYRRYRPLVTLDTSDDPAIFLTRIGNSANDEFGRALDRCGDQNSDGFEDLLVGAPDDDTAAVDAGAAFLLDAQTGLVLRRWTGPSAGAAFGSDVACIGALVAIGATRSGLVGGPGGAVVVYPVDGDAPRFVIHGRTADDDFGHAIADAGDVDGDQTPDILVGAPGTHRENVAGYAAVFSGEDGSKLIELGDDGAVGDRFGFAVAGVGDHNDDGRGDVVISAVGHRENRGQVTLFSGADGTVLRSWEGDGPGQQLGHGVDALGDLDGDGRAELLFGAFDRKGTGYVRVVDAAGDTKYVVRGASPGDGFAHSVAGVGDVDLDGVPDLAVGAPNGTVEGIEQVGYVGIYSGVAGQLIALVQGRREQGHFGHVVAPAGDVDGDGRADVLVGNVVVRGPGRAHVLVGVNLQR